MEHEFDGVEAIKWQQWDTVSEKRMIKDKEKAVERTVKTDIIGTSGELVGFYLNLIPRLSMNVFTISHQFENYSKLKSNVTENAVIMVDFSENYSRVNTRAVQSAHFGESNNQISLHIGVAYLKDEIISFSTVSESTKHEPAAIWAHLLPILALFETTASIVHNNSFLERRPGNAI